MSPNETVTTGIDAWLTEHGAPAFVGLDRSKLSGRFTYPLPTESLLTRVRRRLSVWLYAGDR